MTPLSLIVPLVLAFSLSTALACGRAPPQAEVTRGLLAAVNALRVDEGVAPLAPSPKLAAIARSHACDMAARGYFGHNSPDGATLTQRLRAGGYRMRAAVENIAATGDVDAARVVRMWRASPGHLANMTSGAVREVGFAAATGPDGTLWVMVGAAGG